MYRRVASEVGGIGREQVEQSLNQVLMVKNDSNRVGGFSLAQWVFGRAPKGMASVMSDRRRNSLQSLVLSALDMGLQVCISAKQTKLKHNYLYLKHMRVYYLLCMHSFVYTLPTRGLSGVPSHVGLRVWLCTFVPKV